MATSNKEKIKMATVALPGCPRCLATLSPPIFLCTGGHSVCGACAAARPQVCQPVLCQQALTQIRNLTLEYLINKAKVACPNHAAGCPQTLLNAAVSDHLQDCAFRDVACPLATALGKCSWTGQWKQILEHVKDKHSTLCDVGLEADKELQGITLRDCDRQVYLAVHQKLVFIVTFKIDSVQRLAYWSVQLAGPKKLANQYVYEIHVSSKRDALRNVTFTEICSSDTVRADDIFRQFACPVLSLDSLAHFVKDDKLSFRYSIRTKTGPTKPKGESNVTADETKGGPRAERGHE